MSGATAMAERFFEQEVQSRPLGASHEPQPRALAALVEEVRNYACGGAQPLVLAGLERTADYQDLRYAELYWQRLLPFVKLAAMNGQNECELLATAASQLALAMTFADSIWVAELKLRARRYGKPGLGKGEVFGIAEFMHLRSEEIVDTMPTELGRRLLKSQIGRALLRKITAQGLLVRSTSLSGFLLLYFVASLKPWRRRSLRFARETEGLEEWLDTVWAAAKHDLQLATNLARARSLLRGYGATYERGLKKFDTICEFVRNNHFSVDADGIDTLIAAAQAEEGTDALEAAIAKLGSQRRPVKRAMAGSR